MKEKAPLQVNTNDRKLLTTEEVSQMLGVKPQTLANWRQTKQHLVYVQVGSLVRYELAEVQRFVERNRVEPTAV